MNSPSTLRIGAPLSGEPHPGLQWIEVASFLQIPGFQVIGLPAPEVAEARERVRAAIGASDLEFPRRRVILNLSPASIRKRGTGADLAMALAVLQEAYGTGKGASGSVVAWGELGLDGTLKAAGQMTCAVYAAWEAGAEALIVASDEFGLAQERLATLLKSGLIAGTKPPRILPARDLSEAWLLFKQLPKMLKTPPPAWVAPTETTAHPPSESQLLTLPRSLERMLGVASTGLHHLLLLGPRGTGKSHALEWLIALQPEASAAVRVRRSILEELSGMPASVPGTAPVRRVSPYARPSALIGSAKSWGVRPGEYSLAHGGLLLADEFPEWSRDSRESLREPLERGLVTLTRAKNSIELPARFMLAANGNLCPCGGWPPELPIPVDSPASSRTPHCRCPARARTHYLSRLSGPVLDRMDLIVMATQPDKGHSKPPAAAQRLQELREQVAAAQRRAQSSWGTLPGLLSAAELERLLAAHPEWNEPLDPARFASLRTRHKVLRVALTLAAWDGLKGPTRACFAEASCYRPERFGLTG